MSKCQDGIHVSKVGGTRCLDCGKEINPPNQDTEVDGILQKFHAQMLETHLSLIEKPYDKAKTALHQYYKSILLEELGENSPELRADFVKRGLMALANQNLGQEILRSEVIQRLESRLG